MAYRSGGYKSPFIGVGAIIGILVVAAFAWRGVSALDRILRPLVTPEGAEQALFANPEAGPIYRTLKRTYPEEFDALIADVVRRAKAGESHSQIDEAILTDVIEAGKRHRRDMIQAPHQNLAAYRHDEIKVMETLQSVDTDLCAAYVMRGAVRSHTLEATKGPLIAFRIAGLEAGAAGRDHPANRKVAKPDPADVQQLARQMMANGTSQATVTAFFSTMGLTQVSPQEQCQTGLSFYRAVDQMPADKADQFYTYLIASAP